MDIIHFGSVRLRVVGSGNLDLTLISLSETETQDLTPVVMSSATNRLPNVLSNFMQQRAQLEIYTDEIDEVFQIDKVIIYIRPTFTSYPQ